MFDTPVLAIAIRWGIFTALLPIIGAVAFRFFVLGRLRNGAVSGGVPRNALRVRLLETHERFIARIGLLGSAVLIPLALGRLALKVGEFRTPDEPWGPTASLMLFETTWGLGWWLQAGAALLCSTGFLLVPRRGSGTAVLAPIGWALSGIGAMGLAMTPALSGHAIGSPRLTALAVAGDTLHVLGAGAWLGSLAVALLTVLGRRRHAEPEALGHTAAVMQAFSPVALVSAALVVMSGVLASWLHVGAIALFWETTYGRLLLVKIALFGAVVALGALNWRQLTPRLDAETGVDSLRTAARAELGVAWLILLVTAVLVATTLPGEG